MLAITISRNVGEYNFQKYWQLYSPEVLAIILVRNAGDKCEQLFFSFSKMASNVNNYIFSEMLAIIISRTANNYDSSKS